LPRGSLIFFPGPGLPRGLVLPPVLPLSSMFRCSCWILSWILSRSVPLTRAFFNDSHSTRQGFKVLFLKRIIPKWLRFAAVKSGQSSASSLFDSIGTLTCVVTAFLQLYLAGTSCREVSASFPLTAGQNCLLRRGGQSIPQSKP
jgi:hypothetical protein